MLRAFSTLALLGLLPDPGAAQPDLIDVHCTVFLDVNEDGVRQGGEPGLPGTRVTDGVGVFSTDVTGAVDLSVDREAYRFATLTIPSGWWPTTSFWHWVPVGAAGPDTVEFGLRLRPETAADPVRWIHITDTHVDNFGSSWPMDEVLEQTNEIPDATCIFNTGDLVDRGSITEHWQNYISQVAGSDLRVFHVVGNHDTIVTATPLEHYEQWVGPPYYSVELGSWHFAVWNSEIGSPRQTEWLAADVAAAPSHYRHALLQHRMSTATPDSVRQLWTSLGIENVFSGHWHSYQMARRSWGMDDYNLSRTTLGPKDRTPRCFNRVTLHADGDLESDLRRLGVDHRTKVTSPASGGTVREETLRVLVQAYDTSSRVTAITASVHGGPVSPSVPLAPEGISLWRGTIDLADLPNGAYWLHANGTFEDGTPITKATSFVLRREPRLPPALGADWPMFRRCPAGSSWTAEPLVPPLELRWVSPIGGMVALSSPVVAGGRVFLGCRGETHPTEAGVGAFDAQTGTPLWFTSLPGGVGLAPAITDDVLIVTAIADSIWGLDPATGDRLWTVPMNGSRYDVSAPVFQGTTAWVGAEPRCKQVHWPTGTVQWSTEVIGTQFFPYIYGAPAVSGSSLYLGLFGFSWSAVDAGVVRLDRATGAAEIWEDFGAWRSPVVTEDAVYLVGGNEGSPYDPFQSLSMRSLGGAVQWTANQDLSRETSSPALGPGVIVASGTPIDGSGWIRGFDAATGDSLWSFQIGYSLYDMTAGMRRARSTSSTAAIADTIVYVGSLDGHLYALGLRGGEELWSYETGTPIASSPALSGDWLFVGASDGHLYAFAKTDSGSATAVRPPGESPRLALDRPHPNPARRGTTVAWETPRFGPVRIRVFDVRGRLVRTLVDGSLEAGRYSAVWNGEDRRGRRVGAGVYFVRLEADGRSLVRKVVRLGG